MRNWVTQIEPAEPRFMSHLLQDVQTQLALGDCTTNLWTLQSPAPWAGALQPFDPSPAVGNAWGGLNRHSFQCTNIFDRTSGERGNCQQSKLLFGLLFVPLWELRFRSYHGKGGDNPTSQSLLQGHDILINQFLAAEAGAQSSHCFFRRL